MSSMEPGMITAAIAVAATAAYLVHMPFRFRCESSPAERLTLTTPDGASLALYRYAPAKLIPGRDPVLMISGFGLNREALDFNARFSWARRLADAGFETWLLEVRGSGNSRRAGLHDGSFDDYLVDARTAVAEILTRTGAPKLHWVGYSLGGMLLYATLGTDLADRIRSGLAIESPVTLHGYGLDKTSLAAIDVMERHPWLHMIPYRWPSRLAIDLLPLWYEKPLFTTWMNTANIDRSLLKGLVYRTLDDVPTPLILQFRQWMSEDGLRSRDGRTDYLQGLRTTDVPLMLVTGASDFARRAQRVFEVAGPERFHWVSCVKDKGFSADYGHADLIFGPRAPEEVFPLALDWLLAHDPAGNLAMT